MNCALYPLVPGFHIHRSHCYSPILHHPFTSQLGPQVFRAGSDHRAYVSTKNHASRSSSYVHNYAARKGFLFIFLSFFPGKTRLKLIVELSMIYASFEDWGGILHKVVRFPVQFGCCWWTEHFNFKSRVFKCTSHNISDLSFIIHFSFQLGPEVFRAGFSQWWQIVCQFNFTSSRQKFSALD